MLSALLSACRGQKSGKAILLGVSLFLAELEVLRFKNMTITLLHGNQFWYILFYRRKAVPEMGQVIFSFGFPADESDWEGC
jgi:hypothetical protein